ncbi:MAG: metallophosphoesterase family protein [Acidimicrobiales bacterium]
MSDVHAVAQPDGTAYGRNPDANLRRIVRAAQQLGGHFDVVLVTGDVADDASHHAYRRVRGLLAGIGDVVLWVPGNHDDPEVMRQVDADALRSTMVASWQIVTLDTRWPGRTPGLATSEALAHLDAELTAAASRHIAVALHHPPRPPCAHPDCQVVNREQLLAVLDRHPGVRAVISGHLHHSFHVQHDGVEWIGAPSTCMQIEHPSHAHLGEPAAAAQNLQLNDDGTVTVLTIQA